MTDLADFATTLCWHCSDPLDGEPVVEVPDEPGSLAHLDCAIDNDDNEEVGTCSLLRTP